MSKTSSSHTLILWADSQPVARITHATKDDAWTLAYEPGWLERPTSFPLSPTLPFQSQGRSYDSGAIKRFVENLLPEGHALDIAARAFHVSNANVFALISALGVETTGAFRFLVEGERPAVGASAPLREIPRTELDQRLRERETLPLAVWDGKVRMSIAGVQDKLMAYLDGPLGEGGRLFLAEPPLASTHILKPEPERDATPHLVVNEHFCMSVARGMGLPVAEVALYRAPTPVLIVRRFDRSVTSVDGSPCVRRLHVIDACQAADLPSTYKYERNLGSGEHVRHIREGMSFETLFGLAALTINRSAARLTLLRWAIFQFLIGNCDAHGKNFSFHVHRQGLEPAPWYDLVSVVQYPAIDHELAMAYGEEFDFDKVGPFQLADFATRCGIDRRLLKREAARLGMLASKAASMQAKSAGYIGEERAFVQRLSEFIAAQSKKLKTLAEEASKIKAEYL